MNQKLDVNLNIIQRSGVEIQIDPLTKDLNIIQTLDDEPNDVGGLSAAELKAKFDEAGNVIKGFINDSLIPQVLGDGLTEQNRQENEAARQANEARRQENETARQEAETAREEAEEARETAEAARAAAEAQRAEDFTEAQGERAEEFTEAQEARAAAFSASQEARETAFAAAQADQEARFQAAEDARDVWEDYDPAKTYVPGNKVYYLGSSYVNTRSCTDVLPTVEENWQIVAKKGADSGEGMSQEEGDLRYLQLAGGRMTGAVTVLEPEKEGNPTTKKYVDDAVIYPQILVATNPGAVVTASRGTRSVSAEEEAGTAVLKVPDYGTWTVTAALEGGTKTETVFIDAVKQYHVELKRGPVYGAEWDGTASTKWSRTDAAAGFTDPVPYVAGASAYGSPFDNIQPWAGMVKEERAGGTMVKIPKFWYRLTQSGKRMSIQITGEPRGDFHVSPAHMDRGDGRGERDVVYIGRYHCGSDFKSVTGKVPVGDLTRADFRASIHALGDHIWQWDLAILFTVRILYLVEYADWNSCAVIGIGSSAENNTNIENTGYTDAMPYHTGTMRSARTTWGVGVQYRNIEGLWDNIRHFVDGCRNAADGLFVILNPNEFSDVSGGHLAGKPAMASFSVPSAFEVTETGDFPVFIPIEFEGSYSTYACDIWVYSTGGYPIVYSGASGKFEGMGLFHMGRTFESYKATKYGSHIMELP